MHRAWSNDTGSGTSCCARQARNPLPLAYQLLDKALDTFWSVRSRGRAGVDHPCPRHSDGAVAVLWSSDLASVDVLSTCGCSAADLLAELGVSA